MAAAATAATTTTTTHLKIHSTQLQQQPIKPRRRKSRETTISSSAAASTTSSSTLSDCVAHGRKLDPPTVVSPDRSWCCPVVKPIVTPQLPHPIRDSGPDSPINSKIRYSSVMEFTSTPSPSTNCNDSFPSNFSKFNSALTAGLLNPMSPPPPPPSDRVRSSPTLYEMMSNEPDSHPRTQISSVNISTSVQNPSISIQEKQSLMLQRLSDILASRSPGNQFNEPSSSDIKLTLSSKDGISISMNVHRQILVGHSSFFAAKLTDRWTKQQRVTHPPYFVEIADCDEVEVYIETVKLMYCNDLKNKLMKEDVSRVLGILKVSSAIGFEAGIFSCLEYLEAAPWSENEEEKVAMLLSELRLDSIVATEVLKRVSIESTPQIENSNENEEVILKLLHVVLDGKDEKARREMKDLVLKMLRENSSQNDLRKESLYEACDGCMKSLRNHFIKASNFDLKDVGQIARQADNLHWILDILIDRQIAEEFLATWASQTELSNAHSKVPSIYRYEVSRVTARLFVGVGKGQLLASKESRCELLRTWLVPFYDDFGWMRRASKGLDRHVIEDGLGNTILTLPLAWQQEIFLAWFNRFLNSGEDCPNIQRGFEVWWRRSFWRRNSEPKRSSQLRVMGATVDDSI